MFKIENTPDQSGKVAIVTGGNAGLGYETVIGLVQRNCKIVMASRNMDRASKAVASIKERFSNAEIEIIQLELSSKASIKQFVETFSAKYSRLDYLINNAGIMMPPYQETEDGFESQFGVNYLGHFFLTGLLMDILTATPDSRVVTLSSLAHDRATINFEDLNYKENYKAVKAYGQSKLACMIFGYELQRRLEAANSSTSSLVSHPGVAITELIVHMPWFLKILAPLFKGMVNTVANGAKPTLMAALDPNLSGGEYVGPNTKRGMKGEPGVVSSNAISKDLEVAKRLWDESERLLDYKFNI